MKLAALSLLLSFCLTSGAQNWHMKVQTDVITGKQAVIALNEGVPMDGSARHPSLGVVCDVGTHKARTVYLPGAVIDTRYASDSQYSNKSGMTPIFIRAEGDKKPTRILADVSRDFQSAVISDEDLNKRGIASGVVYVQIDIFPGSKATDKFTLDGFDNAAFKSACSTGVLVALN